MLKNSLFIICVFIRSYPPVFSQHTTREHFTKKKLQHSPERSSVLSPRYTIYDPLFCHTMSWILRERIYVRTHIIQYGVGTGAGTGTGVGTGTGTDVRSITPYRTCLTDVSHFHSSKGVENTHSTPDQPPAGITTNQTKRILGGGRGKM